MKEHLLVSPTHAEGQKPHPTGNILHVFFCSWFIFLILFLSRTKCTWVNMTVTVGFWVGSVEVHKMMLTEWAGQTIICAFTCYRMPVNIIPHSFISKQEECSKKNRNQVLNGEDINFIFCPRAWNLPSNWKVSCLLVFVLSFVFVLF